MIGSHNLEVGEDGTHIVESMEIQEKYVERRSENSCEGVFSPVLSFVSPPASIHQTPSLPLL